MDRYEQDLWRLISRARAENDKTKELVLLAWLGNLHSIKLQKTDQYWEGSNTTLSDQEAWGSITDQEYRRAHEHVGELYADVENHNVVRELRTDIESAAPQIVDKITEELKQAIPRVQREIRDTKSTVIERTKPITAFVVGALASLAVTLLVLFFTGSSSNDLVVKKLEQLEREFKELKETATSRNRAPKQ